MWIDAKLSALHLFMANGIPLCCHALPHGTVVAMAIRIILFLFACSHTTSSVVCASLACLISSQ